MNKSHYNSARYIAFQVLNRFNPLRNYAGEILQKFIEQSPNTQQVTDIVYGTIRNRIAIDVVIGRFAGCPIQRIEKRLLDIIRIACYELIYSPRTQQYAIVNEAVKNAGILAGKKQAGFVNAILRRITGHILNRQIILSESETRCTMIQDIDTGCVFDESFLPDKNSEPVQYLGMVFSLPDWLVENWLGEFGYETTEQICLASNRKAGIYIRPNILKTTAQSLQSIFNKSDIDVEMIPGESVMKVTSPRAVPKLPGFEEGLFVVQDITASRAVRLLNPQPGWRILDMCAAPGIKVTQAAEITGDNAEITATDISAERLEKVRENIQRLGLNSIDIVPYEKLNSRLVQHKSEFDCVVLDVPCSNIGVLAKRVEARYRLNPKAVESLTIIQKELLNKSADLIRPGGKICYSTCSVQKNENNAVISSFLGLYTNFRLDTEQLILPCAEGFDCDGGYVAILVRQE